MVFDGDDTLWISEPLYDQAREAASKVVEENALDPIAWETLQRRIDLQNVLDPKLGYSPRRFPTSCKQAYRLLCERTGLIPVEEVANEVFHVAATVFRSKAPLVAGADETLRALRSKAKLVLLTKGDKVVQRKRIAESKLNRYFDSTYVVANKTENDFFALSRMFDTDADRSWSIGNSISSDIKPAHAAGWNTIWIDAHVWEHERKNIDQRPKNTYVVGRITDAIPLVLGHYSDGQRRNEEGRLCS